MKNRAALLACLAASLLSGWAASAQAQEPEPCRLQRLASFDLTYDIAGRPVIPATIDDKPVRLLVDSAGLFTALDEARARSMGLHLEGFNAQSIRMFNGRYIAYKAATNSIMIGHAPLKNFTVMILPKGELPDGVDGSLGPDILSHLDVDFDFAGNKMNLFAPSKCGERVVYWADDYSRLPIRFDDGGTNLGGSTIDFHNIRTPGMLDGTNLKITIDTGSTTSVMSLAQAKYLFHWSGEPPELKKTEAPGSRVYYSYPFKTLTMNGITVNNPKILVYLGDGQLDDNSDMILGMNVLRQLHLYVAYNQRLIYATAPPAKPAAGN